MTEIEEESAYRAFGGINDDEAISGISHHEPSFTTHNINAADESNNVVRDDIAATTPIERSDMSELDKMVVEGQSNSSRSGSHPSEELFYRNKTLSQKLHALNSNIIGSNELFTSPYGEKPLLYCDWTASGRALRNIENYIQDNVLRFYGNTHTTTSITGHQSTCFRHESRQIIAEATNAKITGKASQDVVLFVGNGTTAAVNKLISCLNLMTPLPEGVDEDVYRPVVFTSSYEHHSNLLPWRESIADVVTIDYNPSTGVGLIDLEKKLHQYHKRQLKIGAFSAASNVTGILTDVKSVSIIMHRANGLVFFDYATAAPYVKMDMNPVVFGPDAPYAYIDGMYFSGHKFLGGCGSPGVLIAKKAMLTPSDAHPTQPGGGTVFYVTEDHHRYLSNREEREESGTPDVIGDIRLGLAVHVKSSIGTAWIEEEEMRIHSFVKERLLNIRNLALLGHPKDSIQGDASHGKYLPIFSFLIHHGRRFLHFNFVCALLNDLFGIQSRGGCQCAGPYSQMLLGLSNEANKKLEVALLDKHEVFRPGYSRLSFPYWMNEEEINFVLQAISFVSEHGWKFLPMYRYNHKTGEWAHTTRLTRFPERLWLSNFDIFSETERGTKSIAKDHKMSQTLQEVVTKTESELTIAENNLKKRKGMNAVSNLSDESSNISGLEGIRWFVLPEEISKASFDMPAEESIVIGVVDPSKFLTNSSHGNNSESDNHSAKETEAHEPISSYAMKRNNKLRARSGGENSNQPRYLTLMDTKLAGTSHDKPSTSTGSLQPVQVLENTKLVITNQKGQDTDKTTIAEDTSESKEEKASVDANAMEIVACTDGSCLMPRKTSAFTPDDIMSPSSTGTIISATGRVLSGPGVVYEPKVKVPKVLSIIPKKIMKLVGQAVKDWNMIEEGDRLLLGLSGGKDSLCLLHVLLALQKRAPVRFELACATVDPQTESYDPTPLIPYLQSIGVTYHYLSEPIVQLAKSKLQGDSLCAFCSRFKRGLLYSCCRNFKYNKLVLGQHLDDLAESFMMSALHNGQIRTMKANYAINAGDIRVIRPLIYIREKQTRDFSVGAKLPIINENCPACFEQPKERARIKKLLLQEESMVPMLYFNLKRGLQPLMHERTYSVMKDIAEEIEKNNKIFRGRVPSTEVDGENKMIEDQDKKSSYAAQRDIEDEDDEESFPSKRLKTVDDFDSF